MVLVLLVQFLLRSGADVVVQFLLISGAGVLGAVYIDKCCWGCWCSFY